MTEYVDQKRYEAFLESAKTDGVHIVHGRLSDGFGEFAPHGGFTLAWARCSEFASGRMIEVAITYCSPNDLFTRKIGTYNALQNFYAGNTIMVPAGSKNSEEIVNRLRSMFYRVYF